MKRCEERHTIEFLFPLIFILFFCLCVLLVVLQGARIYEKTAQGLQENYTVRTAISYLKEKVKECGDASDITLHSVDQKQVLTIHEKKKGEEYATYIYVEDGKLKELYTKEDTFSGLQGGQDLVPLDGWSVNMEEENLIRLDVEKDGKQETAYIRLPVTEK